MVKPDRTVVSSPPTATPHAVRQVNRAILLDLIRRHQPVSRADLARMTGMHRSNVSFIVEELIGKGFLREEKAVPSGRGRAPFSITLRDDSLHVLGANMRYSETAVALGMLNGDITRQISFETPQDPAVFVKQLSREIRRLLMSVRPSLRNLVRQLTLSVPGHINSQLTHEIWIPALPNYSGYPLQEAIEEQTGISTQVMNNASLGALAEIWLEGSQSEAMQNFVMLVIGDVGTGSGLVFNGQLYLGHDQRFAGEIGHTVIDPNGPPCACGRRGCWQLYVSDRATWRRYRPRTQFSSQRFASMVDNANNGDDQAIQALRETAEYLALGIANIIQFLNPGSIVISGAVTGAWEIIEPTLKKALAVANGSSTILRPARETMDTLFLQGAIQSGLQRLFHASSLDAIMHQP